MRQANEAGWSNPRVLTIFALIFLCGAAFGSAVTRAYLHSRLPGSDPHLLPVEGAQRAGLESLKAVLGLTPEQERAITQELDEYSKYYENIEEQRRDVADHGKMHILQVLNAEQRRKFNDLFPQTTAGGAAH